MSKTHGVFIGRFQPLHLGHQAVINEIIADWLHLIVIIGSAEEYGTQKNPYPSYTRRAMLSAVYGHKIGVEAVNNNPSNDAWVADIIRIVETYCPADKAVIYYHRKEVDCLSEWGGQHYVDLLKGKIDIQESTYATRLALPVSATDIRSDLEAHRHFLDGRVYRYASVKRGEIA